MVSLSHSLPLALSEHPAPTSFLDQVRFTYTPGPSFPSLVLNAVAAMHAIGLTVSFISAKELCAINSANKASWLPLLELFDYRFGTLNADNFLGISAFDADGRAVACHAARYFSWPDTTFYDEAVSLRLFHGEPEAARADGERYTITAASTHDISGQVVFSGSAWIRPDYRGRGLYRWMPRLGKVLAAGRWAPDWVVSFMSEAVHRKGFAERFGYPNVDWEVLMQTQRFPAFRAAFLSMTADDLYSYVEKGLVGLPAEVDARIRA